MTSRISFGREWEDEITRGLKEGARLGEAAQDAGYRWAVALNSPPAEDAIRTECERLFPGSFYECGGKLHCLDNGATLGRFRRGAQSAW